MNKIVILCVSLVSIFIGYAFTSFVIGKDLKAEVEQAIVTDKLLLMSLIADTISNAEKTNGSDGSYSVIGILCGQIPYLKEEAVEAGDPVSKYADPGHIEYSRIVEKKYIDLSKRLNITDCNL